MGVYGISAGHRSVGNRRWRLVISESAQPDALILLGYVYIEYSRWMLSNLAAKISKFVFFQLKTRLNKSVIDIVGSALVVPTFTGHADHARGNQPDRPGARPLDV